MSIQPKKRTTTAITLLIALILILAGTFAWYSFNQSRVNVFNESVSAPGVNLHDDFAGGPEKDVYVENGGAVPTLVRVRLAELLNIGGDLLPKDAVDDDDAYNWHIHVPYGACEICDFTAHQYFTWAMDGQKLYMPAHISAKGGGDVEPLPIGDKAAIIDYAALLKSAFTEIYADDTAQRDMLLLYMDEYLGGDATNAESLLAAIAEIPDTYTVNGVKQYPHQPEDEQIRKLNEVRLTLIPTQIIMMQDWIDGTTYGEPFKTGDFWVVDADGWCYWATILQPEAATGQLLSSVTYQDNYYGEETTYKINVHLNATTFSGLDLGAFYVSAAQNGGISERGMILMFLATGEYIFGEDGELYKIEGSGFYSKINKNPSTNSYVNYLVGERVHAAPGTLPGGDGGINVGGEFSIGEDGKLTEGGDYKVIYIEQGENGVVYFETEGGIYLVPVDENGKPDNSGTTYAIVYSGEDGKAGTDDDIGPIRADESYPQWYLVNIAEVGADDVISAGEKGTLIKANSAEEVPLSTFGVNRSVYKVLEIVRGENKLLYLKLDADLYAVALDVGGEPVMPTKSEKAGDGEEIESIPDTYYIVYASETGKIGTESDTTDATPMISAQPSPVSAVYDGAAKTLSVTVSGAGTLYYQWYRDGEEIAGANASTFEVRDVADSGEYYCKIVADIKGQAMTVVDSDAAAVNITARPLTITADNAAKTYDGTALTAGYSLTGTVAAGDSLDVTVSGSILDVGTADNVIESYTITRGGVDVSANYSITTEKGSLTVNKRDITITAGSASKPYDGTELTCFDHTVTSGSLANGDSVFAMFSGSITDAGTVDNVISVYMITRGETDVTANYNVTLAKGSLTVNKRSLSLAPQDASKVYDGTELTATTYRIVSGSLASGETVSAAYSGAVTAVGAGISSFESCKIMRSSTDVTANYSLTATATGTLTVNKRELTITSKSGSKVYDGAALTLNEYDITTGSVADGEVLTVRISSSPIKIGTYANTIQVINNFTNVKRDGVDVTENYTISAVNGTLTITSPFSSGTGTVGDPVLIASKADLEFVRDKVNMYKGFANGMYFTQTADIDLGNALWDPIGNAVIAETYFNGTYDGDGYKISGLNVNTSDGCAGLFGYMSGGAIKNLMVKGSVETTAESTSHAGGIVGVSAIGSITGCVFSGTVKGTRSVGGIAGTVSISASISNCAVTFGSEITANSTGSANGVGGIVGYTTGPLKNNYSLANVSVSSGVLTRAGGISGYTAGTTLDRNAYLKKNGICEALNASGAIYSSPTITSTGYFTDIDSEVTGTNGTDGTIAENLLTLLNNGGSAWVRNGEGWPYPSAIRDKGWNGAEATAGFAGGNGTVNNPYLITSPNQLARACNQTNIGTMNYYKLNANIDLCGIQWEPMGNASNPYKATFDGNGYTIKGLNVQVNGGTADIAAGLFGYADGATIKNLRVEGYVSGITNKTAASSYNGVGGIVGYAKATSQAMTISNCSFKGNIYGSGGVTVSVGGIMGRMGGSSYQSYIENCYIAYGSRITSAGSGRVGGITGLFENSTTNAGAYIKNSYSLAAVSGDETVSGVIGSIMSINQQFTLSRCAFLSYSGFNQGLNIFNEMALLSPYVYTQIGYFGDGGTGLTATNSSGTMPANLLTLMQQDIGANQWRAAVGSENGGYPVLVVQK